MSRIQPVHAGHLDIEQYYIALTVIAADKIYPVGKHNDGHLFSRSLCELLYVRSYLCRVLGIILYYRNRYHCIFSLPYPTIRDRYII